MERKMERREREERRRNFIIRGATREGTIKQAVEEVLEKIGAEGRVERVRELKNGTVQGKERMIEVRMEDTEGKKEVMRRKRELRGRREKIEDDLTWKERRMQWKLRKIGDEEERRGKRVRLGYGKVIIEGATWFWDESREVLRDWRGKERETGEGEGGRQEERGAGASREQPKNE